MSNKTDMERVGLFQEMTYHTIGDKFKPPGSIAFNVAAGKGKQMLSGASKERSAKQDGYFDQKFNRILEGEAYSDPIKTRRQNRIKENQKNLGKPFLPSNGDKRPSGLGNHYGTLSGPIPYFSAQGKLGKAYSSPRKNFYTNPAKRGTGYGYTGLTLGPYIMAETDIFDRDKARQKKEMDAHKNALKGGPFKLNMHPKSYFDANPFGSDRPLGPPKKTDTKGADVKPFKPSSPAKKPGGLHAGTFDNYPSHSVDPYNVKYKRPVHVVNKTGKTFMPSMGPKSAPMSSIVNQNVTKAFSSFKTSRMWTNFVARELASRQPQVIRNTFIVLFN